MKRATYGINCFMSAKPTIILDFLRILVFQDQIGDHVGHEPERRVALQDAC